MDKERFLQSGLLEQYVLGLTTEEENEEVERFARAFPEIKSEIDLLQNAIKQYAEEQIGIPKLDKNNHNVQHSDSASRPPQEQSPPRISGLSSTAGQWVMAACLVLSAVFSFFYYSKAERSQQRISELNTEFLAFKNDCQKDQVALQNLQEEVAFFEHNRTNPLQLEGTSLAPGSEVRVFWNEQEKRALLQVIFLPQHPANKQYQIWGDIEGKMVDLGLIDMENPKPQLIRCMPQAASLNITLEPAGGSEEPHVDQLYANVNLP